MEKFYEALRLHSQGLGYRRIAKTLGVSPSTVRNWVKGRHRPRSIPPTPQHPNELKPSPQLSYVLGAALGDGCAYIAEKRKKQKVIVLRTKDRDFAEACAKSLETILERPVKIRFLKDRGLFEVRVTCAALYELLKRPLEINRLRPFVEHCDACVAAFIRGFFDAEGCVNAHKNNFGDVTVYNSDIARLLYIKKLLMEVFGIETTGPYKRKKPEIEIDRRTGKVFRRKKPMFYLRIPAKSRLIFFEKVGFTIRRKQQRLEEYCLRKQGKLPTPIFSFLPRAPSLT